MHKKWTDRVELTKKTSPCKSRDFFRKRRLKMKGGLHCSEIFSVGTLCMIQFSEEEDQTISQAILKLNSFGSLEQ